MYWCQDDQLWDMVPVRTIDYDGWLLQTFVIRSSYSVEQEELCLDVEGTGGDLPNGTPVGLFYCRGWNDNQEWYWLPAGNIQGAMLLGNYQTGKCLDVDGQAWNRTNTGPKRVWLYDCYIPGSPHDGTDDHLWSLEWWA